MLTDAELAAIEARVVEFQAARAAVTGDAASRHRYHAARAALDRHREDDLLALVAEVRRLRTLAAAQMGAATSKARGLQSRSRAASSRRPEAPTRARRLAGRPTPRAAATQDGANAV